MELTNQNPNNNLIVKDETVQPPPSMASPSNIIKPTGSTPPKKQQVFQLSKSEQIKPPMAIQKAKFQPTAVGIIYEEISLLDAYDDTSTTTDFPSLFESQIISSQYSNAISENALELQPKLDNKAKISSNTKRKSENKRKELQNLPITTKEAAGKQFRFDERKAVPYLQPTKLKNFLVHANGGSKNAMRMDPLAGSFNSNANSRRENTVRTSQKLNELLSGHQTTHNISANRGNNLPLLKPPSQPKKDLVKTSYLPFFNASAQNPLDGLKHDDLLFTQVNHLSDDHSSLANTKGLPTKIKRPKSGENGTAALKKIYVGQKEKVRKFNWASPGLNP